jgi:long-subunit acyl-CoA synthetase (AMP-forming)
MQLTARRPDGKEPPLGQPGEILVRTRRTMVGSWDDPEHTAETLRDGWLHTGTWRGLTPMPGS